MSRVGEEALLRADPRPTGRASRSLMAPHQRRHLAGAFATGEGAEVGAFALADALCSRLSGLQAACDAAPDHTSRPGRPAATSGRSTPLQDFVGQGEPLVPAFRRPATRTWSCPSARLATGADSAATRTGVSRRLVVIDCVRRGHAGAGSRQALSPATKRPRRTVAPEVHVVSLSALQQCRPPSAAGRGSPWPVPAPWADGGRWRCARHAVVSRVVGRSATF